MFVGRVGTRCLLVTDMNMLATCSLEWIDNIERVVGLVLMYIGQVPIS